MSLRKVRELTKFISCSILGTTFSLRVENDMRRKRSGRTFIQIQYKAPCTKTSKIETWNGRKWYLSDFMTDDEIVKTAYCAFEAAVKHEVMEGFKFNGIIVFNPHVDFRALLKISHKEIKRK